MTERKMEHGPILVWNWNLFFMCDQRFNTCNGKEIMEQNPILTCKWKVKTLGYILYFKFCDVGKFSLDTENMHKNKF